MATYDILRGYAALPANAGVCARAAASAAIAAALQTPQPPHAVPHRTILHFALTHGLEGAARAALEAVPVFDAPSGHVALPLTVPTLFAAKRPAPDDTSLGAPLLARTETPPQHGGMWKRPRTDAVAAEPPLNEQLCAAAGRGDVLCAARLLCGGADVNARAADGTTPLWRAIAGSHVGAVRLLLSNGASLWRLVGGESVAQHAARLAALPGAAAAAEVVALTRARLRTIKCERARDKRRHGGKTGVSG